MEEEDTCTMVAMLVDRELKLIGKTVFGVVHKD